MLQCPEIMLQAHQMMKTEVCSVGEPHMAPLASGHVKLHNYPTVNDSKHLPFTSCLQTCTCLSTLLPNCRQSSRNKAPKQKQNPTAVLQKPELPSCCISFRMGYVPGLLMAKRDHHYSLFNEMTKQQICICRSRCCNRFDDS